MRRYKTAIIMAVMVCLCVGYYAHLSSRSDTGTPGETVEVSEVDKLLTRDLEHNYPNSADKVVSFYSDIMKIYYAEGTEDETIQKLGAQSRKLLDEELLSINSEEDFDKNLESAVDSMNQEKLFISQYAMGDSKDVIYSTGEDGLEYAGLTVKYFLRNRSGGSATLYMDFVLRKDNSGNWKILGWMKTPQEKVSEN